MCMGVCVCWAEEKERYVKERDREEEKKEKLGNKGTGIELGKNRKWRKKNKRKGIYGLV